MNLPEAPTLFNTAPSAVQQQVKSSVLPNSRTRQRELEQQPPTGEATTTAVSASAVEVKSSSSSPRHNQEKKEKYDTTTSSSSPSAAATATDRKTTSNNNDNMCRATPVTLAASSRNNNPSPTIATATAPSSNNLRPHHGWWKKSVVRRSMSSIEPDLDSVMSKSTFLQRHAADDMCLKNIGVFHRSEIITGKLLGRGGFSNVYEILEFQLDPTISKTCAPEEQCLREYYAKNVFVDTNKTGQTRYCIKHLQERLVNSPRDFQCAASDLAVEASYMSSLEHKHILKVRGLPIHGLKAWNNTGRHDGYFIIMDQLETTLDKKIQEWKNKTCETPSVEERLEMALQLSDAIRYLHKHRIVFRDLKPHNIGFSAATGSIQLFDFGLCRELPASSEDADDLDEVFEMSGVGTRRYMATEIINSGRYNLKADVYGWAMVIWELLKFQKPFATYTTADHKRKVCRGGERPELLTDYDVPVWINELFQESWEESVHDRLTMNQVYERLLDGLRQEEEHGQEKKAVSSNSKNNKNNKAISSNSDLNTTNHEQIIKPVLSGKSKGPPTMLTRSPSRISDFPDMQSTTLGSADLEVKSIEALSVDQCFICLCDDSPPPAPKKPAMYLKLPDIVAKNIAMHRNLAESDDEVSGIYSIDHDDANDEHSFAHEQEEEEVWP